MMKKPSNNYKKGNNNIPLIQFFTDDRSKKNDITTIFQEYDGEYTVLIESHYSKVGTNVYYQVTSSREKRSASDSIKGMRAITPEKFIDINQYLSSLGLAIMLEPNYYYVGDTDFKLIDKKKKIYTSSRI